MRSWAWYLWMCRVYLLVKSYFQPFPCTQLRISKFGIIDFIITIFTCRQDSPSDSSEDALEALAIISLIFSSLFVLELLASIWAFGLEYFKSKFHVFDAFIISASFIIDVLLRGPVEEVASLIIVLRLWRVVKIIEELSVGAQEEMEGLQEKVQLLEQENEVLKRELQHLRSSNAENR